MDSSNELSTDPTEIQSPRLENPREKVDSSTEGLESLQDSPEKAGSVSGTLGAGPAKPKKQLSPAQIAHLEKMRETRSTKKETPKAEPIIKVSAKEEFELWQKKQMLKKDASWKKMLDARIDAFEQTFTNRIQERLYEILESPLDEFYSNSKKHRKRKPEPEAEEEQEAPPVQQTQQSQKVPPSSKRNNFQYCF